MPLTVKQFLDNAEEICEMSVECGVSHLDRPITEQAINRPGLALAGFFNYFANKRIQVLGLGENSYLRAMEDEERKIRLDRFMGSKIPCLVLTRSRHASDEMKAIAERHLIPILRSTMITSHFINQATIIMEDLASPTSQVHGTMLDIAGIGVLLEGEAGVGKSETALGLVERGHSLVADDLTMLKRTSGGTIIGSAGGNTRHHMEIRGLGIVNIPNLFGMASIRDEKRLDIIIKLYKHEDALNEADRTGLDQIFREVHGVQVPVIELPVAAGRDMANVIEVAAMNQKLKLLGYDAAQEFNKRLIETMKNRP